MGEEQMNTVPIYLCFREAAELLEVPPSQSSQGCSRLLCSSLGSIS